MFWDGTTFIAEETLITSVIQSSLPRLCEQGLPREGEDDCWVGEAALLRITTPFTPLL